MDGQGGQPGPAPEGSAGCSENLQGAGGSRLLITAIHVTIGMVTIRRLPQNSPGTKQLVLGLCGDGDSLLNGV